MDVVTTGQEVGVKSWIMQQSLENNCLIASLSHVPDAASTTTRTRILVRIVLDVELRGRVIDPFAFTIYQMSVACPSQHMLQQSGMAGLTLGSELREGATEPFQVVVIDEIHTSLTEEETIP